MQNWNINDVSFTAGENRSMSLRQLSSFGSSFLRGGRPALCRAGFRSSSASSVSPSRLHLFPAPPPWWTVRGFPPWPPRLHRSHPAAAATTSQVFSGRTARRSFNTSAGPLMERHDKEPPQKRRKSVEEKGSAGEREGHKAGGKDGGSKKEHRHLDPNADSFRPNHRHKDGGGDGGKHGAGNGSSRESSRDKERTKTGSKDRDGNRNTQRKDGAARDETPHRGRSTQQQQGGGHKDSQPAATRTHSSWSKPEPRAESTHKPSRWDRGPPPSRAPSSNHWQVAGGNRHPPPPGTCPPVRQQQVPVPMKALQRHWENSPACSAYPLPPGGSAGFDFSVLSYNILSQDLLQDNSYLYRHCHPGVLSWDHRLPNLLAEIQHYNADILCLQEVQKDHYEHQIRPALTQLGYHCEYKKRTGNKPDGCAVIFKTSRLSLVSSNPVEFFRPGDALLDRDNVGLVVLLRPNDASSQSDPSSVICIANTHLLYNPRRGDIKLAQLAILFAEIRRLSRLPDGSTNPVVLCGDFNSTPLSPLYSFLTTGCLEYQGLQIGMVSGQETSPRGQRLLMSPLWSHRLGINQRCQYEDKHTAESSISPAAVEGAICNMTVEDLANKAAAALYRARIEHSLKLQSSYQHCLPPDGRPEITTCHSRTAMTVDYILYTPTELVGRGLQLLGRLSLVGQSELEEVNGLPNHQHSSDHLPLLAGFRYRR
ncbi:protein angel homolog 2 isoform X1 [Scomber scombrus]|uniref:protein angel homolog 2 isoform X1 n=1 Tax=Scomber scombrus TaxID=13677 RepID=UPI002DD9619E|nr:protein angel homolog 2 isoform X1 [Scomber scombrus]